MRNGWNPGTVIVAVTASVVAVVLAAGVAVASPDDAAAACQTVDAPMLDVPRGDDQEPLLRVPVPEGWEQPPQLDPTEPSIRMAILNPGLAAEDFTPNAVIALKKIAADGADAQQILDAQNEVLIGKAGVTGLSSRGGEACGLPAMTSSYTTPAIDIIPARSATTRVVVYAGADATYVATVTIQAIDTQTGSYNQDAQTILEGFQVLPPN
ncbi:MAG: hypothetical protein FGM52_01510 [Mycobacterium sp.]|nr:hypothetical protein [Mycobacterium sp.]